MSKVLGITSASVLGHQINRVRKKESYDGDDPGCYEQFPIAHRWQQRQEAQAELRVTDALGISSDRQKWEDRRDADHLKESLCERERKNETQLCSAIRSSEKQDATDQVRNVMNESGHASELDV